jgi:trehalose-phosphatase
MPKVSMCVYIGDDETDEDAFEAIRARGYGIRVGDADTRTAARGFLPDVQAVREFLEAWSDLELEPYGRKKTSWIRDG